MSRYTVWINGKNANRYIDRDSFEGVTLRCESDDIWTYYLDTINIDLHKGFLELVGIAINNLRALLNTIVRIKYNSNHIFGGLIKEISYNAETDKIVIEVQSWGKAIAEMRFDLLTAILGRVCKTEPQTIEFIAEMIKDYVNKIDGTLPVKMRAPYVDVEDFTFYKTYDYSDRTYYGKTNYPKSPSTIFFLECRTSRYEIGIQKNFNIGDKILVYLVTIGSNEFTAEVKIINGENPTSYLDPVTHDCRASWIGTELRIEYVINKKTGSARFKELPKWGDPAIDEMIKNRLSVKEISYKARAIINKKYWAHIGTNILIFEVDQTDYFEFKGLYQNFTPLYVYTPTGMVQVLKLDSPYNNSKIGNLLKDIGILKNCILYIDYRPRLNIVKRNGSGILNLKATNFNTSSMLHEEPKVELPEGFILTALTKNDIIGYYDLYYSEKIDKSKVIVKAEEVSGQLILKHGRGAVENSYFDFGVIKSVNYGDDLIELDCEKYYAEDNHTKLIEEIKHGGALPPPSA